MTTLDSLLETVKNYKGLPEETKSENSDREIYDVLTFGDTHDQGKEGYDLPCSDGKRRVFSFRQQ